MNYNAGLLIAWKEVMSQKKLVAIIVIALTIGIVNTAIVTGVMRGFEKYLTEDIIELFTGQVIIMPSETGYIENPEGLIEKIEKIDGVYGVLERSTHDVKITPIGGEESTDILLSNLPRRIIGLDPEQNAKMTVFPDKIIKGEWFTGGQDEMIMGERAAEDVFRVTVGDSMKVEFEDGQIHIFKIIGIIRTGFEGIDLSGMFVDISDLSRIRNSPRQVSSMFIKLYDRNRASEVKAAILSEGVKENVNTWDELLGIVKELFDVFSIILLVVSGMSIVAASFGIAILMYINVLRKTKQIGTLKAMGASSRFISAMFVLEAVIIAVLGVVVGNIAAITTINFLNKSPLYLGNFKLQFVTDYNILIASSAITMVFVTCAAIYPAYVASKLQVIEAMRHD